MYKYDCIVNVILIFRMTLVYAVEPENLAGVKFGELPTISVSKNICGIKFDYLIRYCHTYIYACKSINLAVVGTNRQIFQLYGT